MTLTPKQTRALVRLLGQYQDVLENAIKGELIPGTDKIFDPAVHQIVQRDRKRWSECEAFVKLLAEGKPK